MTMCNLTKKWSMSKSTFNELRKLQGKRVDPYAIEVLRTLGADVDDRGYIRTVPSEEDVGFITGGEHL